MKNKYFVKKSHLPGEVFLLIPYAVCVGVIGLTAFQHKSIPVPEVIFSIVATLITLPLCIRFRLMGLYINGKDITVKKVFTTKRIDPHDIVAIKILQSYYRADHVDQPIVDMKGTPHYTAFLLTTITSEIYRYKGTDISFMTYFSRYIMCSMISDPEAIKYLKTLNPRIKII